MKKITDRGRKILSRLFRVISVSAASLILQACYGMMLPDEPGGAYGMPPSTSIRGKVSSNKTGEPIPGIKVSIDEATGYYTNTEGYFNIWSLPIMAEYKIKLEDVDGSENGGLFKEQTLTLKKDDTDSLLLIVMELDS